MAEEEPTKEMSVREAGRKGGKRVKEIYGLDFYSEIGKKGGASTRERYGPEFYSEIGTKGGSKTAQRHGPEYYAEIGKKGGAKVKELIKRGQDAATAQIASNSLKEK